MPYNTDMPKRTFKVKSKHKAVTPVGDQLQPSYEKSTGINGGDLTLSVDGNRAKRKWFSWWMLLPAFLVLLFVSGFIWVYSYVATFEAAAGVPWQTIWNSVQRGRERDPFEEDSRLAFLILGIDEVRNQREGSLLTDTMMVVVLDKTGRITLISLPRDLWVEALKTKINALYYYGEAGNPGSGSELATSVITDITGLSINGTMVVGMDTVKAVVDALDGIWLDVPNGFTDTQFPRDNVNIHLVTDPELLFQTVVFDPGWQQLDGNRSLQYIRSRQSELLEEGNDLARVRRQQQVVNAIIAKVAQPSTLSNAVLMGNLFSVWNDTTRFNIDDELLISLAWHLRDVPLTLITTQIPVQDKQQAGIIIHPPVDKYNLWVYEPVDPTWQDLKIWVEDQLSAGSD
jgi:LCP family protein required for cell wall assembly